MSEANDGITVTIDPQKLTVGFFEDLELAQETGKFTPVIRAYSELLGIKREDIRKMTLKEFQGLAERISKAVSVPNGKEQQ
jgi:hypothetical protein